MTTITPGGSQPQAPEWGTVGSDRVRVLERGLQLLKCFDMEHPVWRIPELAEAVGLHKATARRLVKTLEAKSFLSIDPTSGDCRLGTALLPMSYLARSHDGLLGVARPFMGQLAAQTEETIGLSVWTDTGIVQVEHIPTPHFFKPAMLLGEVTCAYGSSHSKIFLAFGPEERTQRLSFSGRARELTPAEAAGLQKELQRVRETGIAYDIEERTEGVCAVSVPVRNGAGDVVASLAVIAPTERFGPTQRESISDLVRQTGLAISRELSAKQSQESPSASPRGGSRT